MWSSLPADRWQALFNTLLVAVGFLQWRVYSRQEKIMAGQRDIAREQTAVLREQAGTTEALATLERPLLFVVRIEAAEFHPYRGSASDGDAERWRPVAAVHFANYGRTPAILLGTECGIMIAGGFPPTPDFDLAIHETRFQIVETGEENGHTIRVFGRGIKASELQLYKTEQLGMLVYGRLIYRGPFGECAETAFGFVPGRGKQFPSLPFGAYNYRKTYHPDDKSAPHARHEL